MAFIILQKMPTISPLSQKRMFNRSRLHLLRFSLDLDLPEVAGWVHDEAKSNDPHDTLRREDDSKDNLGKIVSNNELRIKYIYI